MANHINGHKLIRFVQHLHDINSDLCGDFIHPQAQERCRRFMDAVLPPTLVGDPLRIGNDLPKELRKAAE